MGYMSGQNIFYVGDIVDGIKIGFIGGDRRMLECAKEMARQGYESAICGFDDYKGDFGDAIRTDLSGAVTRASAAVLPLPCLSHGLNINAPFSAARLTCEDVFAFLPKDCILFCGKPSEEFIAFARKRNVSFIDYFSSERLQILNAIPTVEGALCAAMNESDITLHSSECLVTGYGRIAKLLARSLYFLGANVTVAARNGDALTWAQVLGLEICHIDEIGKRFGKYDFVFNTVPARIIGEDVLSAAKKDSVLVELASSPGGFDREAAEKHGLKLIFALGLPGKNAPKSAGIYISKVLLDRLGG